MHCLISSCSSCLSWFGREACRNINLMKRVRPVAVQMDFKPSQPDVVKRVSPKHPLHVWTDISSHEDTLATVSSHMTHSHCDVFKSCNSSLWPLDVARRRAPAGARAPVKYTCTYSRALTRPIPTNSPGSGGEVWGGKLRLRKQSRSPPDIKVTRATARQPPWTI